MTNDVPPGRYAITVDWPTGKETVEVSGLGVFPNHETTELTEEQIYQWFNRTGANPMAQFPVGITVSQLPADAPKQEDLLDFPPPVEEKTDKAEEVSTAEGTTTEKDGA